MGIFISLGKKLDLIFVIQWSVRVGSALDVFGCMMLIRSCGMRAVLPNGFAILGCHYSEQVFSTSSQATARNYESANNSPGDDQYLFSEGTGNGHGDSVS